MPKRILQGPIVSDKGEKTVVVRVDRAFKHPLLAKVVRRSKRYHAHDESNELKVGQRVLIRECPPKSKLKRWEVVTEEQVAADAASAQQGEAAE
ncbi:ribosomal protein S17 [Parvularcula bermudensis HTCC2503]|uniref:Small ribosomal subunit protein uS17 n=1 Tax=Parvularcula bermudensis (strain ATCC BAA-594 / HTCC2503 / KCTC 12087) TaxID=314260 RepID=E0TDC7_PARBH|nr:30S ribosomal protein S17 [Parvularcula bermudensis]ADM09950.1 ribosomal protein S17 [Parvularcula bermudensis HTCC2503]